MTYDAQIDRLPLYALFDLKGPKAAISDWTQGKLEFPERPNTLKKNGTAILCNIGPDRWLLRDDLSEEDAHLKSLRPAEAPAEISIVHVSDTQTFFRITGPDAQSVMSIGCTLDLDPVAFGEEAVSNTEFFGIKALVLRSGDGFECAVEQSFGNMIADYLARAMA